MFLLLVFLVSVLPLCTDGGKIFWGTEAKPHSRPYMAFIEYYDSNSYIRRCGGCLVEKDIVMTAAHCLGRKMRVTLGVHNIMENKNIQVIPIQKAKRHEAFDSTTLANDIMLLKLERKAQNNSFVKTIALPKSQDWVKPGQVCTVAGWGELRNCVLPNTLREVSLEVQNSQKCQEMFNGYNNFTQICVGNPKEKKATGRFWGPFVCDNVAQGIVSRHHCTGEIPQVFTRVFSFIPWIKKTIKLLQKP